jgi:hypothetical protein
MIGTGIIFKLVDGTPKIERYIVGDKSTFPAHVGAGEILLITDEKITTSFPNGGEGPDPDKAIAVVNGALASGTLRTILWQTP